jgi:cysteine desulfurase / selenocysteine lyase
LPATRAPGPQGVGGLIIKEGITLRPWREGGTGSRSHEVLQPSVMPDYLEAGTMNMPGIAGLEAGIDFIESVGLGRIRCPRSVKLAGPCCGGLQEIPGTGSMGPANPEEGVAVVSFTMEGVDCGDVGFILEEVHGILCRTGLHCAPGPTGAWAPFSPGHGAA